jgi:hypothetical protein
MLTQSLNAELEGYHIYSLSKPYDSLSLWAKYAAGHSGYCLEFANDGPFFEYAKEVEYGDFALMDLTGPILYLLQVSISFILQKKTGGESGILLPPCLASADESYTSAIVLCITNVQNVLRLQRFFSWRLCGHGC